MESTVPFTDRSRVMILPLAVTRVIETGIARVLKFFRALNFVGSRPLPPGHADVRRVDRIGRRILLAATNVPAAPGASHGLGGRPGSRVAPNGEKGLSERAMVDLPRDLQRAVRSMELVVVDNASPNACLVPGHRIVIHSGLLRMLNDDELAMVIGHEAAHCIARHVSEGISAGVAAGALFSFLERHLRKSLGGFTEWVSDKIVDVAFLKPRSRRQEVGTHASISLRI